VNEVALIVACGSKAALIKLTNTGILIENLGAKSNGGAQVYSGL
jgi:hypothetical protein